MSSDAVPRQQESTKLTPESSPKWPITIAAGLGWLFDSYVISIYGLTLPQLAATFKVPIAALGIVGTLFLVGYLIGTVAFGWIGDRVGRKIALGISILGYGIVTALTAFAPNVLMVGVFRFLTGVGGGGELTVGAPFVAEAWETDKRSRGIGIMYSSYAIGFTLAILAVLGLVPTFGWRGPYVAALVAAVVILFVRLRLSESPRYIALLDHVAATGRKKMTLLGAMRRPDLRKSLGVGALIFMGLTYGYYALGFYITAFIAKTYKVNALTAARYQLIFWAVLFVCAILAGVIADRVGTRLVAVVGSVVCMVTTYVAFGPSTSFTSFMILMSLAFGSIGALWTVGISYVVQQFPTEVRGSGFGTAAGIGRVFSIFAPGISVAIASINGYGLAGGLRWNASIIYLLVIVGFLLGRNVGNRELEDLV